MRILSFALVLSLLSLPVLADEYPYAGMFTYDYTPDDLSDEDQLSCVFNFFVRDNKGTGTDYTLDLAEWQANGRVSYVPVDQFTCSYDKARKTEDCSFHGVKNSCTYNSFAQVVIPDPNRSLFRTFSTARERLSSMVKADPEQAFPTEAHQRCNWLTEAVVAAYLAPDASSMTREELGDALLDPLAVEPQQVVHGLT